jgi:hypothetical protein
LNSEALIGRMPGSPDLSMVMTIVMLADMAG